MGDLYAASPEEMMRQARRLDEVADAIKGIFDRHHASIDGIGDGWGDDTLGRQFYAKYQPSKQQFDMFTDDLSTSLRQTADQVVETAKKIIQTEGENSQPPAYA